MRRFTTILAAAALTALLALTASAQQAAKGDTEKVTVAGQQVAIDAKTGKLRQPTPEESRQLAEAMKRYINHSAAGLTAVQHSNGMKSVNLQGRFQSAAVATRNADGSISEHCVTSQKEAEAALKGTSQKPKQEVK